MTGIWLLVAFCIAPARAQLFTPEGDKQFAEGLRHLYNLDYDKSLAASNRLIELEPENPFAYLGQSGMIWWQASSEYGLFKDTPTLEGVFERDIDRATSTGEQSLKAAEGGSDREAQAKANFVLGMALGTRGQWKLLRGHWIAAYFDGKHAVQHLNRCLELDPQFFDAYIGLGLYDYETAHLPKLLRISALLFVHGDAKRGIERLALASEKARYTPSYAAQYLASIYLADLHDDAKALPILDLLRARYPESLYFRFIETMALARLKDPSAFQKAKALAADAGKDPAFFGRKQLTLWCGLYGEKCLRRKAVQDAEKWLTEALDWSSDPRPTLWNSALYFYRGVARDMLGLREPALTDYQRALEGPDSPIRALAQHCVDEVCDRQDVLAQLKSMSLEPIGAPKHIPRKPDIPSDNPDGSTP